MVRDIIPGRGIPAGGVAPPSNRGPGARSVRAGVETRAPVFSVVAPCQPGAALRDLCHDPRGQDTSRPWPRSSLRPCYCTAQPNGYDTRPPRVRHPGRRRRCGCDFLVLAQDNFTLKLRSASAAGDPGHAVLHRGARRRRPDPRQRLRRADQRRSGVSRDARGDPRRQAPHQLRDLHLRYRRDRQSVHRRARRGRATRRARQLVVDAIGSSSMEMRTWSA